MEYHLDFVTNIEDFLLKEEHETRDNLKANDDIEFLNTSLDLNNQEVEVY
jgi:hypothetical protein